jgi:hypothetical protein
MDNTRQLIDRYASSDFETRLNMCLSYRSLRSRFSQIDDARRQADKLPNRAEKGAWLQRLVWRWMGT